MAASMLPSDSASAFLQSIMPAPDRSRSRLMSAAEIFAMCLFLAMEWWSASLGVVDGDGGLSGASSTTSAASVGGLGAPRRAASAAASAARRASAGRLGDLGVGHGLVGDRGLLDLLGDLGAPGRPWPPPSRSRSHSGSGSSPAVLNTSSAGFWSVSAAPARDIRPSATASATTRVSSATERIASSLPGIG